jgi:hypothetical protein
MGESATILCAGPGLGFYVPGAILAVQLRRRRPVDLVAIEGLLPPSRQATVRQSRLAFHRDFRVALMGQRVARDITAELDGDAVAAMLLRWGMQGRRRFIVFSGFWVPLVERYLRESAPASTRVDYCHVDTVPSTSWRLVAQRPPGVRDVWFASWEEQRLCYRLDVSGEPPLAWGERSGRLLAHGGGWGMGTYRERIRPLQERQLPLDVLCYEPSELTPGHDATGHYYLDPDWFPWTPGDCLFPRLGQVDGSGSIRYTSNPEYPELFRVIRRALAMISKPGGGTLIDSLAAATPLILLEPFGDYERKNGLLWKHLGFAIDFDDWFAGGCQTEVLEALHRNLLAARAQVESYADHCCASDEVLNRPATGTAGP